MPPRLPDQPPRPRPQQDELLPFKPWMLALAVLLACALGVAIMEDLRAPRDLWAQASVNGR
ncbi:MAG: hypothetical protein IPO09_14745 [Anaeromyxobacter sp.]|nr:hypothetical protein [Anaeromyxobacter sp.]MBL0277145.1 hypothetical protein [Anaeromyxobacter sp.]